MKLAKTYYPQKDRSYTDTPEKGYFTMNNPEKMVSVYKIMDKTIGEADEVLLKRLLGGYGNDIDKLFEETTKEVYRILYGRDTQAKIQPTIAYLQEMNVAIEEQMCKSSLAYFCSNRLNMDVNWHHLEWAWLVENFPLLCVLAARDHGKSFFFSHGFSIWMMYKYDKMSKDQYVLNGRNGYLFSNTQTQAIDLLEIIKDSIVDNDALRERLYPDVREVWSKGSIKTKNGCRLRVRGLGSTVRGAHPGYIILDDPLKDNVLYSKNIRDKNKAFFNASILPMLVPGGQMVIVGTPFHVDDLYSLFENGYDFAFRKYPAIDSAGNLLWDRRHNKVDLDMRRRVQGNTIFTREFLVRPISDQSTLFPEDTLKKSIMGMGGFSYVPNVEAFPIKFRRIITGCDFAMSASVGADYTSFVTFGVDHSDALYLLNIYHKKGVKFHEQRRALLNIWKNFKPDVLFLESNQFQSIYSQILTEESSMPIKPFITTSRKQDLKDGVPGLALLFENGKIHFPYQTKEDKATTDMILEEFSNIGYTDKGVQGIGSHDDIVMSIWIARMAQLFGSSGFTFDFVGENIVSGIMAA